MLRRLAEPLRPLQRKELARGSNPPSLNEPFDYDLVTQLATIPARISMYDLLRLSPETRSSQSSLASPEDTYVNRVEAKGKKPKECEECMATREFRAANIVFSKDDLLLGEMKDNRPLYPSGYIGEAK